jgi:hypothetical protein
MALTINFTINKGELRKSTCFASFSALYQSPISLPLTAHASNIYLMMAYKTTTIPTSGGLTNIALQSEGGGVAIITSLHIQ